MVPRRTPVPHRVDCCGRLIAAQIPPARAIRQKTQVAAAGDYAVSIDPSARLPASPGSCRGSDFGGAAVSSCRQPREEHVMETENVALIREAYQQWHDSRGASVNKWLDLMSHGVRFRSLAGGAA